MSFLTAPLKEDKISEEMQRWEKGGFPSLRPTCMPTSPSRLKLHIRKPCEGGRNPRKPVSDGREVRGCKLMNPHYQSAGSLGWQEEIGVDRGTCHSSYLVALLWNDREAVTQCITTREGRGDYP